MVDLPLDASQVWAEGPGLEADASGLLSGETGRFIVHTEKAGKGDLNIRVVDPKGRQSPANILDNGDGTFTVEYAHELENDQIRENTENSEKQSFYFENSDFGTL